MNDFETIAGGPDLGEEERTRLLAVHEALLIAGPPAELPPHLEQAPRPEGTIVAFPNGRRRAQLLIAAAIALVAFAAGAAVSQRKAPALATAWTQPMRGTQVAPQARATIAGTRKDSAGNWKMIFKTTGLPRIQGKEYYVLWLTKHGRPVVQCGTFLVNGGTTVETFAEPYEVHEFDGWVVTLWKGRKAPVGPALLRTEAI